MSTTEFRFDLPPADHSDPKERICARLAHEKELITALTWNLKRYDPRAVYVDGSFSVRDVALTPGGEFRASCSFAWEAYYGCDDVCRRDVEQETVTGHIEGSHLVLWVVLPEPRSTVDEL